MSKLQGQSTIFLHKPTKLPRVSQLKSVRPLSFPVVQFLVLVMEAPSLPCSCCCRFRQLTRSRLSRLLNQSPLRALLCLPRKARDTESISELSPSYPMITEVLTMILRILSRGLMASQAEPPTLDLYNEHYSRLFPFVNPNSFHLFSRPF